MAQSVCARNYKEYPYPYPYQSYSACMVSSFVVLDQRIFTVDLYIYTHFVENRENNPINQKRYKLISKNTHTLLFIDTISNCFVLRIIICVFFFSFQFGSIVRS